MKDATLLTPPAYEPNSIFKREQLKIHYTNGPENDNYTMVYYGMTFYSRHTRTKIRWNSSGSIAFIGK